MRSNGRILYINHDSPVPAGGVRTIYYHVSHLVRNGYPAFVVHNQPGFRPSWFEFKVPVLYLKQDFRIFPNDIVVIPEDNSSLLEAIRDIDVRKYVFCQNHFYLFSGLKEDNSWEDYGVSGVLCSSDIIGEFIRSVFSYGEVSVVHYAIPLDHFKPRKKKLQIACMPRKRPFELQFIKDLFKKVAGQYGDVPWVFVDKMDEGKVAEILSESAIYLSTSLYEGFGLPPIEAMACGCVVVGFHGYGGLEYARNDNGFWCEEGNIIECALKLGQVVSRIDHGDQSISTIRDQAIKTAHEYNFDRQEKEVIDFWCKIYPNVA